MGFWEFIVIAVVGTIVLGPDKLPAALRRVVKLKRLISQNVSQFSADINEQLRVHELHENLKKAEQQGFENLTPELKSSLEELQSAAESVNSDAKFNIDEKQK